MQRLFYQPLPHLVLIFACVLTVYANSLHGSFQYDDFNVIVDEPRVHSWSAWLASMPGIRPLLKASYVFSWKTGSVVGFHLFNLACHLLNALLVYVLGRLFFAGYSTLSDDRINLAALLAALLFALHPANTEAVTYISGRSLSLTASFYLAALTAYLYGKQKTWLRWLALWLFALALGVKEVAVTLPFALWLWQADGSARLARLWPFFALLGAVALVLLLTPVYDAVVFHSFSYRSLQDNLSPAMAGVAYLFKTLLWPMHLSIDPAIDVRSTGSPVPFIQFAVIVLLAGLAAWRIRRRPGALKILAFALLWFFLHLLPTHSLIPRLDPANDRHLYLAAIGPCFALAYVLTAPGMMSRALAGSLAVTLLTVLAGLTLMRNEAYRSEISLWQAAAHVSPNKPRVQNNLGYALALQGRYAEAERAYRYALQEDPNFSKAKENLLILQSQTKETRRAAIAEH